MTEEQRDVGELDSAQMQLHGPDPASWLKQRLADLLQQGSERLNGSQLEQCQQMLATVRAWPDGLYAQQQALHLIEQLLRIEQLATRRRPSLWVVGKREESESQPVDSGLTTDGDVAAAFRRRRLQLDATPAKRRDRPRLDLQPIELGEKRDRRLIVGGAESERAERFRALYYRLSAMGKTGSILVTAATPGEGTSTCAANLALAMAESSPLPPLLIEAQFHAPTLASMFGFEPRKCFARRLAQHRREPTARWAVGELNAPHLRVLAARADSELQPALDGQALADVIELFGPDHDHIVIDGPAVLDSSDAALIAQAVDGVVLTLRNGVSRARAVKQAVKRLGAARIVGYVLLDA